jgi:hypothetical protein
VSDTTTGTGDAFNPVNHDYDIIWLWLNPLLIFTVDPNNPANVQANGYGYDPNDPAGANDIDKFPVLVGCLNGHFGACPSVANTLARSWVTTNEPTVQWPAGDGPGINSNDIAQILKADPFTDPAYSLPSPLPLNSPDGRFQEIVGNDDP